MPRPEVTSVNSGPTLVIPVRRFTAARAMPPINSHAMWRGRPRPDRSAAPPPLAGGTAVSAEAPVTQSSRSCVGQEMGSQDLHHDRNAFAAKADSRPGLV
ncbi:hypothetical protein GCM10027570_46090 [Streptomonospora sediminis]